MCSENNRSIYKLQNNYILRKIADSYMIVPVGDQIANFGGMIETNKTVAAIWDQLKEGADVKDMVATLCNLYEVSLEQATSDLEELLEYLVRRGMVICG